MPASDFNLQLQAKISLQICDQLDFYLAMCNDRNYTWKDYLDGKFNSKNTKAYQFLLTNMDLNVPFEIKARIVELLSNIFIDQEPRQQLQVPILCKTVNIDKG